MQRDTSPISSGASRATRLIATASVIAMVMGGSAGIVDLLATSASAAASVRASTVEHAAGSGTDDAMTDVSAAGGPAMGDYSPETFADEAAAVPDELAVALRRDVGLSVTDYLAESAAAIDAVDVVAELTARGVDVLGSSIDGTTLTVDVASTEDRAAVLELGADANIGTPEPLDLDGLEFVPAFDVDGGEGYAWTTSDGRSSQCSLGFMGRRITDGRPVAVTAGHCTAGMATISGSVRQLVQTAPGNGGRFGQTLGSPAGAGFGDGLDGGLLALDGTGVEARAGVVTWGGGTGAPRASATLPVLGQSAAIVGATLCKSGSRTGWTCGTVRAVDRTVQVGDKQVNSIIATTCIQPGDSGGAALIGQNAVGINSSTSSAACGTAEYVSAFFPMVSAAGKSSIASQFGSVWEPSFAVSTPTLETISTPTNAAATLSGAVGQAGAQTTVRIYVDGAASPSATVRADSGRWTLDLSTLAAAGVGAGEHRITAVAAVGRWSTSGGIDTTLTFAGSPAQLSAALLPAVVVTR